VMKFVEISLFWFKCIFRFGKLLYF
jgi:hypothetical protein